MHYCRDFYRELIENSFFHEFPSKKMTDLANLIFMQIMDNRSSNFANKKTMQPSIGAD